MIDFLKGISSVATTGAEIFNTVSQHNINQQQMELYNQQLDWSKAVQQETWNREDTALQRRVEDAQAAGISPLASVNGHSSGTVVSQPSLPSQVAPQFDASSIQSGIMETANLAYLYDKMNSDESLKKADQDIQREKMVQDLSMHQDKLAQELVILHSTNDHQEKMLVQEDILKNNAQYLADNHNSVNIFTDESKYQAAMGVWTKKYSTFLNSLQDSESNSGSISVSGQGSTSAFGTGASGGGSLSTSDSNSLSFSQANQEKIKAFFKENPLPVMQDKNGRLHNPQSIYSFIADSKNKGARKTDPISQTINTAKSGVDAVKSLFN